MEAAPLRNDLARGPAGGSAWWIRTPDGLRLRIALKHGISDEDIAGLNIPTGIPLFYELDDAFQPVTPGGRYLDPEAARASIEAVKNQGR